MNEEDIQFLIMIRDHVKERPNVAAHISDYVQSGLEQHIDNLYARLSDMETIALIACSKKFDGSEELIIDKIESIKNKTSFKWDGFIEDIKRSISDRKNNNGKN